MTLQNLSETVGVPEDQLKLLFSLLITIPLGSLFQLIPNPAARKFIGLILGLWLQYFVYEFGIISTIIQTIISYALTATLKKKAGKIVFVESLAFMSVHHIYRQYTDYGGWKMDITTVLMMFTCKYTSFAYCVEDGHTSNTLSADQTQRALKKIPSFYDYFAYIFFFSGSIVGPSYDYKDWEDYIENQGIYSSHRKSANLIIPALLPTLKNLLFSFFFMALIVSLAPKFPLTYCGKEEFKNESIFYQFLFVNISITLARMRYYSGFCMAQCGAISCGLSYNGIDEKGEMLWDKVLSAEPILELYSSPKEKIDKWNISVQLWLRRYVYFRIFTEEEMKKSHKKTTLAQNLTFLVSAFWHGFYPSYYVAFIHWFMVSSLARFLYKLSLNYPKFPYENIFYKILRFIIGNFFMNYYGVVFLNLNSSDFLMYLTTFWLPNVILYSVFFFFTFTGFGQKRKDSKKIE